MYPANHDFCGFYVTGNPIEIESEPFYFVTQTKTGKEMFLSVSMMIRAWKMEKKVSVGICMI